MKIALIGYGKMGQELNCLAASENLQVVSIIDPAIKTSVPAHQQSSNQKRAATNPTAKIFEKIDEKSLKQIEVAIDFSHPEAVINNIEKAASFGKNLVIGTTGWLNRIKDVEKIVKKSGIGLIYASNFSIGVNLFWKIIRHSSHLMNNFPEYDVFGHEFHHNQKADSPSGTALTTAKIILEEIDRKSEIFAEKCSEKIPPHKLHFSSTRGGSIPGTHSVFFDSPEDTIEITHTARSRAGFARGALKCAHWIKDKTGLFSIEDYFHDIC